MAVEVPSSFRRAYSSSRYGSIARDQIVKAVAMEEIDVCKLLIAIGLGVTPASRAAIVVQGIGTT